MNVADQKRQASTEWGRPTLYTVTDTYNKIRTVNYELNTSKDVPVLNLALLLLTCMTGFAVNISKDAETVFKDTLSLVKLTFWVEKNVWKRTIFQKSWRPPPWHLVATTLTAERVSWTSVQLR